MLDLETLEYDVDPTFHVRVGLHHPLVDDVDALPMWEWMMEQSSGALVQQICKRTIICYSAS